MKIKILKVKGAKDPDEYIKKYGSDAFRSLLGGSENSSAYRLEKIKAKYDLTEDDQKLAFLNEAIALVSGFRSSIEAEIYVGKLSELTGIRRETIESELKKSLGKKRRQAEKREMRENTRPAEQVRPTPRVHYHNVALARAVEGLIVLVAQNPELDRELEGRVDPEEIGEESLQNILKAVRESVKAGVKVNPDLLADRLSADERRQLAVLLSESIDGPPKRLLADYLESYEMEVAKIKARTGSAADLMEMIRLKKKESLRYGNSEENQNG